MGESRYDGFFENDRLNGRGILLFENGDYYDGEWVDNRQEGFGEYHWADGSAYFGEWEDDLQNGEGELFLADGSSYSGDFVDGKYWGEGVFCYANGDRYEGEFEENSRSGAGVYEFADGASYFGEFKSNKIDGKGRFLFSDGSFYEGEFSGGKLNGSGSLFVPSKSIDGEEEFAVLTARWNGNSFPEFGLLSFPNGDEFSGKLSKGLPTNEGEWRRRGEKSAAESAADFYKAHESEIENIADKAQLVLAGVSLAGDVVATVAIPCPPVAGVAIALSRVADVAGAAISAAKILAGGVELFREVERAKAAGDENRVRELKKEFAKAQVWNASDIVFLFGSSAWKTLRSGKKIAKASKSFPALQKAISNTGKLSGAAKSTKIGDKFVRSVVEIAYGRVGKSLVSEYGDDAAKLLFKYGDGAIDALTKNASSALKIAKKNPAAFRAFLSNGSQSFELLEKFPSYADEIANVLAKSGRRGAKNLLGMGAGAKDFLNLTRKYGDDFVLLSKKTSAKNAKTLVDFALRDEKSFAFCKKRRRIEPCADAFSAWWREKSAKIRHVDSDKRSRACDSSFKNRFASS